MPIEAHSFGRMVIDGRAYTSDLIVYPGGRVADGWWRAGGHRLTLADIADLIAAAPEVIVAGTGVYGRVIPDREVERALRRQSIRFLAEANEGAVAAFNRLSADHRVGGCFHLTC